MLANLLLLALGAWGLHYTWTRRKKAGSSLFFDLASPVRHPKFYLFAVGLRLVIFGLCFGTGAYGLVFGITD